MLKSKISIFGASNSGKTGSFYVMAQDIQRGVKQGGLVQAISPAGRISPGSDEADTKFSIRKIGGVVDRLLIFISHDIKFN